MSTVTITPYAGGSFSYVTANSTCAYASMVEDILRTTDGVTFTVTGQRPSVFSRLLGTRAQDALFARDNRSPDLYVSSNGGASWDVRNVPTSSTSYFLYTSATRILIADFSSRRLYASANDGVTWVSSTSNDFDHVVAVPSGFYMVSANRLAVQYSVDGVNWQPIPSDAPVAPLQAATASGEIFLASAEGYLSSLVVLRNGRLTSIDAPTSRRDRFGLAAVRVGDAVLVADPLNSRYIAYSSLDAAPESLSPDSFLVPNQGGPVGQRAFNVDGFLEFIPSGGAVSNLFWTALAKAYETP